MRKAHIASLPSHPSQSFTKSSIFRRRDTLIPMTRASITTAVGAVFVVLGLLGNSCDGLSTKGEREFAVMIVPIFFTYMRGDYK